MKQNAKRHRATLREEKGQEKNVGHPQFIKCVCASDNTFRPILLALMCYKIFVAFGEKNGYIFQKCQQISKNFHRKYVLCWLKNWAAVSLLNCKIRQTSDV
jgi:hypothetical protein